MPIIGVPNPSEGTDEAKNDFIEQMSTQVSHVLDDPGGLWSEYDVLSQPTMVFVAADGSIERSTGALGPQGLLARVEELAGA